MIAVKELIIGWKGHQAEVVGCIFCPSAEFKDDDISDFDWIDDPVHTPNLPDKPIPHATQAESFKQIRLISLLK